jgi:[ribosomal protein S18]-alanine N-acetyltransferase
MPPDHHVATAITWKLRAFRASDVPAISSILRDSTEAAQWPPESYANLANSPGGLVLVCDSNARVIGFIAARQAADEAEILNVAVDHTFRRKGVASALLLAVLDTFRRAAIARVFLELRESNLPARALYERQGFIRTGRRKSYYANPTEDALCMLRKFTGLSD